MRSPQSADTGISRHSRRNSLPSRLRSTSQNERPPVPEGWASKASSATLQNSEVDQSAPGTPISSTVKRSLHEDKLDPSPLRSPTLKSVDCLIAEDNPISSKVLETILVRLGCRCVVVHNGEEVIRCTMGELVFDVIFVRCFHCTLCSCG